jgi:hypothetical protein
MQSIDAMPALHRVMATGKSQDYLPLCERLPHGIRLAPQPGKGGCITKHSTEWRKIMLNLVSSIRVGFVGTLLTAVLLAADWYIWKLRYQMSRRPVTPPPDGDGVMHLPSASGRELVVTYAPEAPAPDTHPVHQIESECVNVQQQGEIN